MIDTLRTQIEDLEREISEYEDLKERRLLFFGEGELDSLGELLTKVRSERSPESSPLRLDMPAIVRTQNKGCCLPCRKQIDDGEEAYVTRRLGRVQLIAVDRNDLVR